MPIRLLCDRSRAHWRQTWESLQLPKCGFVVRVLQRPRNRPQRCVCKLVIEDRRVFFLPGVRVFLWAGCVSAPVMKKGQAPWRLCTPVKKYRLPQHTVDFFGGRPKTGCLLVLLFRTRPVVVAGIRPDLMGIYCSQCKGFLDQMPNKTRFLTGTVFEAHPKQ